MLIRFATHVSIMDEIFKCYLSEPTWDILWEHTQASVLVWDESKAVFGKNVFLFLFEPHRLLQTMSGMTINQNQ